MPIVSAGFNLPGSPAIERRASLTGLKLTRIGVGGGTGLRSAVEYGRSPREPRFTSSDLHASTFGYNAAHRGAERDIFPRSGGGADRMGTLLSTSGVPMAGRRQVCRPANISRIKQSSIASRSTSRKWRSCSQATFRCPITTSARANRRSRPVATIITDSRAE